MKNLRSLGQAAPGAVGQAWERLAAVARENEIDMDRWVATLEDAMALAAKKQHRIKEPVRATLNLETGQFEVFIVKQVVEKVEDPLAEWTVEEAREHKDDAEVGEEILIRVSTEGLDRIAARSAQVLYQRDREAERENVYNEFIDRVGEILNGTVKRFERGDIVVDLGRTEAVVPRYEQARHERYSQGERIRAVVTELHAQPKAPQIVLSRTDPRLLVKLFEMVVPEIYDGTVVIKNAVRAPGERAKVAVFSRERDVDAVGACVGMKGSRVQSIIRELRGEKIDIIEYSDDLVTFAQSALAPARISRVSVTYHGEIPHLDVIVEDEQLSLAIGKRGQNVRLASELIGARIDIKSESDVKNEVADALARMLQTAVAHSGEDEEGGDAAAGTAAPSVEMNLTEAPGIGPKTAAKLAEAGYSDLATLAAAGSEALTEIEGVGAQTAENLLAWAREKVAELGAEETEPAAAPDEFATSSTVGDEDFMAALSRAFQESEAPRRFVAKRTERQDEEPAEAGDNGVAETVAGAHGRESEVQAKPPEKADLQVSSRIELAEGDAVNGALLVTAIGRFRLLVLELGESEKILQRVARALGPRAWLLSALSLPVFVLEAAFSASFQSLESLLHTMQHTIETDYRLVFPIPISSEIARSGLGSAFLAVYPSGVARSLEASFDGESLVIENGIDLLDPEGEPGDGLIDHETILIRFVV